MYVYTLYAHLLIMSHFSIAANTENPAETIVQIQELGLYLKHVAAPFFSQPSPAATAGFFLSFSGKRKTPYITFDVYSLNTERLTLISL